MCTLKGSRQRPVWHCLWRQWEGPTLQGLEIRFLWSLWSFRKQPRAYLAFLRRPHSEGRSQQVTELTGVCLSHSTAIALFNFSFHQVVDQNNSVIWYQWYVTSHFSHNANPQILRGWVLPLSLLVEKCNAQAHGRFPDVNMEPKWSTKGVHTGTLMRWPRHTRAFQKFLMIFLKKGRLIGRVHDNFCKFYK